MSTKIQIKRGSSANWSSENPVLAEGELGLEADTNMLKIGKNELNWNSLQYANSTIPINYQGLSYTLSFSDAGKLIQMGSASSEVIIIPNDSSVNFAIGTKIEIIQTGEGQITIEGEDFTPNSFSGLNLAGQWAMVKLVKLGENSWLVSGDLSA